MEQKSSMKWVVAVVVLLTIGAAGAAWFVLRAPGPGAADAAGGAAERSVRVDVQVHNSAPFAVMMYWSDRQPIEPDMYNPAEFDSGSLDRSLRPNLVSLRPGERTTYTYRATSADPALHTMPLTLWAPDSQGRMFVHGPQEIDEGSWTVTIEAAENPEDQEVFTATLSEGIEHDDTPVAP